MPAAPAKVTMSNVLLMPAAAPPAPPAAAPPAAPPAPSNAAADAATVTLTVAPAATVIAALVPKISPPGLTSSTAYWPGGRTNEKVPPAVVVVEPARLPLARLRTRTV